MLREITRMQPYLTSYNEPTYDVKKDSNLMRNYYNREFENDLGVVNEDSKLIIKF
jgi:hypothetical protein